MCARKRKSKMDISKKFKRIMTVMLTLVIAFTMLAAETYNAAAKTSKKAYLIKVNRKANVVTVYKKKSGKYKPVRSMRVSCGKATKKSNTTPKGTFNVMKKKSWGLLYGHVWGRITIRFYRDYLFHTVPYKKCGKNNSILAKEYKKIGKNASGGSVRMQYIDIKWLRDTCPKGTKVIVYSSKNPGPLGMPGAANLNTKKKYSYDPTDPSKNNKLYSLRAPVINVSKNSTIAFESAFNPMSGVTAKDIRTMQNLTDKVKYLIYERDETGNWKKTDKVDTSKEDAEYKVKYSCKYKYCSKKAGKKTVIFKVEKENKENEM